MTIFRAPMSCWQNRTDQEGGRSQRRQWLIYRFFERTINGGASKVYIHGVFPSRRASSRFLWIPAKLDPLITPASRDIWRPTIPLLCFTFLSHRVLDMAYYRLNFRDFLRFFELHQAGFPIRASIYRTCF